MKQQNENNNATNVMNRGLKNQVNIFLIILLGIEHNLLIIFKLYPTLQLLLKIIHKIKL